MEYDPYPTRGGLQTAAQQQASDIREASLRNKADETQKYLHHAGDLLDQLEMALHGPRPTVQPMRGSDADVPQHPGLRATLEQNSAAAAVVVSRLQTLLNSL